MGDLAMQYGYYGAEWEGNMDSIIAEAGEALTVADPKEAWVFHITPDDTGTSAVWVAQRVSGKKNNEWGWIVGGVVGVV